MQFTDAVSVAGTRQTADGYLIADAKAVRTGIQTYLGSEVGKPEHATVRVYRSEAEVRSADSLRSFSHAPVTVDHPSAPVTSANWKDLAVGEVSTAATWDGNRISLPLILKDAGAIHKVADGKRELSAGYTCDLEWLPGVTPDGQAFDAQQKNIRANHVAIVDVGRAGPECRIGDAAPHRWGAAPITLTTDKEKVVMTDTFRTVVVDGLSVSTTDQGAQAIDKLTKDRDEAHKALQIADAAHKVATEATDEAHKAAIAAKDKELGTRDAEIAKLKGEAMDAAALDKLVADRAAVFAKAKAITNDVDPTGKAIPDIRRLVVGKKLGDAAVKDRSDDYVEALFDGLAAQAKPADPLAKAIAGGLQTGDGAALIEDARAKMITGLTDAWKAPSQGAH